MKITNKQRGLAVLLEWKDAQRKRSEGITEACDFLLDFKAAFDSEIVPDFDKYILHAYYSGDRPIPTQTQLAEELGVHQSSVSRRLYSAVESIGKAFHRLHLDDYDYLAKTKLTFNVIAVEDAYVSIEEVKRVKCTLDGEPPEGFTLMTYPNSRVARNTDLFINQRKFDGSVTVINLASGDDYHDGFHGLVSGEIIDLDDEVVHFEYIPEVDYLIKNGDIIAKVEVVVE